MDQQIALIKQEHEEAVRQLKQQHSKELEAEVDRHREELETALTRAQLCLLSPSLPHSNDKELEALKADHENTLKERDSITKERDALQHKVRLVTRELEESAKSLIIFTEQLSERDEKIGKLKDEIKSLYISLSNVNNENQAIKSESSPIISKSHRVHTAPSKPLFQNPMLEKYWGMLFLVAFGLVLTFHHLLFSGSS